MQSYIAILRGINVGGNRKLPMANLRDSVAKIGFTKVQTYIQSGNLLFTAEEKDSSQLERLLEKHLLETYDYEIPVIVRTTEELKKAFAENSFALKTPIKQLHLTFLKENPNPEQVEVLHTFAKAPEEFVISDKNLFLKCTERYSAAKLTNAFIERKLKITATTRNWKTITKLVELLGN